MAALDSGLTTRLAVSLWANRFTSRLANRLARLLTAYCFTAAVVV